MIVDVFTDAFRYSTRDVKPLLKVIVGKTIEQKLLANPQNIYHLNWVTKFKNSLF